MGVLFAGFLRRWVKGCGVCLGVGVAGVSEGLLGLFWGCGCVGLSGGWVLFSGMGAVRLGAPPAACFALGGRVPVGALNCLAATPVRCLTPPKTAKNTPHPKHRPNTARAPHLERGREVRHPRRQQRLDRQPPPRVAAVARHHRGHVVDGLGGQEGRAWRGRAGGLGLCVCLPAPVRAPVSRASSLF